MVDYSSERRLLPIFPAREALIREFRSHICCLVIGETGSGKTTQIPQVRLPITSVTIYIIMYS